MFPAGAPGVALLLMRLASSGMLVLLALTSGGWSSSALGLTGCGIVATTLCLGLGTPISGALCAAIELSSSLHVHGVERPYLLFLVVIPSSLAMLGPGAYSLDARMFGRRIISAPK